MTLPTRDLLTPREVADYLAVSEAWVRSHARTLHAIRIGPRMLRIPRSRLLELAGQCPAPAAHTSPTDPTPTSGRSGGAPPTDANTDAPTAAKRKRGKKPPASPHSFEASFPQHRHYAQ